MKAIFLDHDGVICLSEQWGTRFAKANSNLHITNRNVLDRFDDFDKGAIEVLNSILVETDAAIIVSSDWKTWATVEELGEYYEHQGIIKKPIDFTEKMHYSDWFDAEFIPKEFPWDRSLGLEQNRYFEITKYLQDHPEITEWVAIDDMHLGNRPDFGYGILERSWGLTNFVWTPDSNQGIKQEGIKEQIIGFLK